MNIKIHHAAHAGFVHYAPNLKIVSNSNHSITLSDGVMLVIADNGDVDRHEVPYGTILDLAVGTSVSAGAELFQTCPLYTPVLAEASGRLVPIDMVEGVTVARQVDEVTCISQFVVIRKKPKDSDGRAYNAVTRELRPRLLIQTEGRVHPCTDVLPVGTVIFHKHSDCTYAVERGDIIAHIVNMPK